MSDFTAPTSAAMPEWIVPWWLILVQGIATLGLGLFLIFSPGLTVLIIVTFLGWWWLVSGIFELGSLFVDRTAWGWKLASGLLSLLAGAYIIGAPLMGTAIVVGVATLMIGINGMVIGVIDIVKAFQGAGWGKGALGVLSLVLGAIIAFNFTSFMVALPWLWGIFAIAGGIAAIVHSFQVRKAAV